MDVEARRAQIEKRLRELGSEREQCGNVTNELGGDVTGSDRVVRMGDALKVTEDEAAFLASEKGLSNKDSLKTIYVGMSGRVVKAFSDYKAFGPAVELQFVDGCKHTFLLTSIEGFGVKTGGVAKDALAGSTKLSSSSNLTKLLSQEQTNQSSSPAIVVAAPSWGSLRKPGAPKVPESGVKVDTVVNAPTTAATQPVVAAVALPRGDSQDSAAAESQPPLVPDVPSSEKASSIPRESLVLPRVTLTSDLAPIAAAPVLSLKSTPRAAAENEDDDLLCPPREDYGRTASWLQHEVHGHPMLSTSPPLGESQIPSCPPRYIPKFPLGDPKSCIPRPQAEPTGVIHCFLVALEVAVSGVPQDIRRLTHNIAFRSNQTSFDAILAACTKELDWGREGRRVTRLFMLSDGTEVMFPEMIRDQFRLVASDGAAYVAPPTADTARSTAASTSSGMQRMVSPGQRPKLPTDRSNLAAKPKVVRVYVNGEYGDVQGDVLPFRTVTIRPVCKTFASVLTLLAREIQWNVIGRRVELLYSSRGDEIQGLEGIVDGESIVVSSGDRFVIPRHTSILHKENVTKEGLGTANERRGRSPARRPVSPYR